MSTDKGFSHQEAFEWPVAVYLYFGGLGGALITSAVVLGLLGAIPGPAVVFAVASGLVGLAVAGIALIFFDLLNPLKAVFSLNNCIKSGISWDVILIGLSFVFGLLYMLPFLSSLPAFAAWQSLFQALAGARVVTGLIAALAGALFPLISGGLLAGPSSIPLWHTPALPVLMVMTSFAGALAWLLLFAPVFGFAAALNQAILAVIIGLIVLVLFTVFAYKEYAHNGPREAKEGWHRFAGNATFRLGVVVIGLLLPLVLAAVALLSGTPAGTLVAVAALAVLLGGYLLRHQLMHGGVYVYPWPY